MTPPPAVELPPADSVEEFEARARARLPACVHHYYSYAAGTRATPAASAAYLDQQLFLQPRVMRNVADVQLGQTHS